MARFLVLVLLCACSGKDEPRPAPPLRATKAVHAAGGGLDVEVAVPETFEPRPASGLEVIDLGIPRETGGAWDSIQFRIEASSAEPASQFSGLGGSKRTVLKETAEIVPGRFARVIREDQKMYPGCVEVEAAWRLDDDELVVCTGDNCDGQWRDLLEACRTAVVTRAP